MHRKCYMRVHSYSNIHGNNTYIKTHMHAYRAFRTEKNILKTLICICVRM